MKYGPKKTDNFIWLLGTLVALLFFGALFSQLELRGARILVNVSLVLTVLIAVWSLNSTQNKWLVPKIFISAAIVILMVIDSLIGSQVLAAAQLFTMFIFISFTLLIAWQEVMFTGEITRNTIFGSICIYLLIGLLFGFAYLIVEQFFPGSLRGLGGESWQKDLEATVYYSMVTLTTLGYGDITPTAPLARFLAYLEAAIGIFYTTVLVASLIGMRLSSFQAKGSE